MMPKRILLVRHGQSAANEDPLVYARLPDYRIPLTDLGFAQAKEVGRDLSNLIGTESFGVFCSPYLRTLQTKEAMLEGMKRDPVFDYQEPTLREQEYGNMPAADVNERNREFRKEFGYFFYRFPNGESCADVYDRMSLFLDSLYRRFDRTDCPANILIVSHGTAIKCFLARWYHWSVEYFESLTQLSNCHVSIMQREANIGNDGKFELTEPFETHKSFT